MTTILDLPDEIHLLIAKHLSNKAVYSLIRACRFFLSVYMPYLRSNVYVGRNDLSTITVELLRANAHHVDTLAYSPSLTEDYYTIVFPQLRSLHIHSNYMDVKDPYYSQVQPHQMTQFARLHPTIKKLYCYRGQPKILSREFWEVVESEWKEFESLELSGAMDEDVGEIFWKVCGQVRTLHLTEVTRPKDLSMLLTLCFPRLQQLSIEKFVWESEDSCQAWTLQLLEQVKKSPGLRHLRWVVSDIPFPVQRFQEMLEEEGCWPALCELEIGFSTCSDQKLATILKSLPSRRLTDFEWASGSTMGPLTYSCLRETYFKHLRVLKLADCKGVTSTMAQGLLTECVHLISFYGQYIYVRDIATAPKPWGCSNLENLAIYIAKEPEDEAGWEGRVFEQFGKLRRLLDLNLTLDLLNSSSGDGDEDEDQHGIEHLSRKETLDLRLCCSFMSGSVQLQSLLFNGNRQKLGLKEALWMVEHWKDLEYVGGDFEGVEGDKVEQLFEERGISY